MGFESVLQFKNRKGRSIPALLLFFVLALFVLIFSYRLTVHSDGEVNQRFDYKKALSSVCQLVYQKHYLGREKLEDWLKGCLKPKFTQANREAFIEEVRDKLGILSTSHLEIYTPQEDELTWSGQSSGDNGLRTLAVNGRFYIRRIIPESSAEKKEFRVGDQIVSLPGTQARFEDFDFSKYSGPIEIQRGALKSVLTIEALPLKVDSSPVVQDIAEVIGGERKKSAWLRISSFRREYFMKADWLALMALLQEFPAVVIDLRGNLGGDFNAVVRALSSFVCSPQVVYGELLKPSSAESTAQDSVLAEDLTEDAFYDLLLNSKKVTLERFDQDAEANKLCFNNRKITVLIDYDSASVSEIFAASIAENLPAARVWGSHTRGDMLLGVWYPLPYVGTGYTLSIPEAVYRTKGGLQIEGKGVTPERALFYSEEDIKNGIDSWLKASAR